MGEAAQSRFEIGAKTFLRVDEDLREATTNNVQAVSKYELVGVNQP
jgi:hypothetical protein